MKATLTVDTAPRLFLQAETAADLMTGNPISIRAQATVREAMQLLCDRGFGAAPVIDEAGRPVGVISQTDLLTHQREAVAHARRVPEFYSWADLHTAEGEQLPAGFEVEEVDPTVVEDIMTPAVFAVPPHAPAARVVEELLTLHVHRLFVVDHAGTLVGVISTSDVLSRLRPFGV